MAAVAQSGTMFSAQALTANVTSAVCPMHTGQAVRVSSAAGTRNGRVTFEVTSDNDAAVKADTAEWSTGILLDPGAGYLSDISLLASTAYSKILEVTSLGTFMRFKYVAGSATGGALNASALRRRSA